MIDTHCHLNFSAFKKTLAIHLQAARAKGVNQIIIPGTDIKTSRKALEIAEGDPLLFVAVGIHPHHVFDLYVKLGEDESNLETVISEQLAELELLARHKKVVAIGEIGLDRHMYVETKYKQYEVTDHFVELQKEVLARQIKLANKLNLPIIIHNREAAADLLDLLNTLWDKSMDGRMVFHCCEPQSDLLAFAVEHSIGIGVDGDASFIQEKQRFLPSIPKELLLLETDAPFLLPEPYRSNKDYPNRPEMVVVVAEIMAKAWNMDVSEIEKITESNSLKFFPGIKV